MKNNQGGMRRAWFRGIRDEDVSSALTQLQQRNGELASQLAGSEAAKAELLERLASAEDTLETFHATLEHLGTVLTLAEGHAREIEQAAEAEAARIRSEADAHVAEAEERVDALKAHKRHVLIELSALRASIAAVEESDEASPAASILALPVREHAQQAAV